jgi:predicted RNA binding protein YcfA (HicA-like mRNA interferase family)
MSDQKIVPINYSLLIKVFEHDGFSIKRRKGDMLL